MKLTMLESCIKIFVFIYMIRALIYNDLLQSKMVKKRFKNVNGQVVVITLNC